MSDTENESTFLETTGFLDWQHDDVQRFTENAVAGVREPVRKARLIFTAVRDRIWYNPYSARDDPERYRASYVATALGAFCVPKAVLLTAAARAAGIPARLGFADVRNHLQTAALRERMGGSDVFVYHGYIQLRLNDRWVEATPAFNAELCARFGVPPIDFDGRHDALLHTHDGQGTNTWSISVTAVGITTFPSATSSPSCTAAMATSFSTPRSSATPSPRRCDRHRPRYRNTVNAIRSATSSPLSAGAAGSTKWLTVSRIKTSTAETISAG